ncbi:hypothetical protein RIF29_08611 [Crotalaria pallida]|uniref:Uncharacterized protein n=1 Tax=Crotalaria pallida TaxID=3830 RepID=A0AAN9FQY8_CROPI
MGFPNTKYLSCLASELQRKSRFSSQSSLHCNPTDKCMLWQFHLFQTTVHKVLMCIKISFCSASGKWTMHDLIREMCKEIVCGEHRDPGKRRHIRDPRDVYEILENVMGTGAIQSLTLDMRSESKELCLNPIAFKNLVELDFSYSKLKKLWEGVQDVSTKFTCYLITSDGQEDIFTAHSFVPIHVVQEDIRHNSDHVFLWHQQEFLKVLMDKIKERCTDNQGTTTYDPKLTFAMTPGKSIKVKEWGVRPIYSSDLFSFSVPLAVETKTKRKRDSEELLDMKPLSPTKKLKTQSSRKDMSFHQRNM